MVRGSESRPPHQCCVGVCAPPPLFWGVVFGVFFGVVLVFCWFFGGFLVLVGYWFATVLLEEGFGGRAQSEREAYRANIPGWFKDGLDEYI